MERCEICQGLLPGWMLGIDEHGKLICDDCAIAIAQTDDDEKENA